MSSMAPKAMSAQGAALRVLLLGESSTVHVSPPSGPREGMMYSRWLEVLLPAAGVAAVVRNVGREGQRVRDAVDQWTVDEHLWSPDVVIVKLGTYECLYTFLPHRLERHINGRHEHTGRLRAGYRRLAGRSWRWAARLQQKLDRPDSRFWSFRVRRSVPELLYLIERIREVQHPLILVLGCGPLGSNWLGWFPGGLSRMRYTDDCLRRWITAEGDPDIRFVDPAVALGWDGDEGALPVDIAPDGAHYSAERHQVFAQSLVDIIVPWARQQPHVRRLRQDDPVRD